MPVTEQQVNEAKNAYLSIKKDYDQVKTDIAAFDYYVNTWYGSPSAKGPLTKRQAKMINITIPSDYSMPGVFTRGGPPEKAGVLLEDLRRRLDGLRQERDDAREAWEDLQRERDQEIQRDKEKAESDPKVIAAREESKRAAEERKQMTTVVIAIAAVVVIALLLRGFKIL